MSNYYVATVCINPTTVLIADFFFSELVMYMQYIASTSTPLYIDMVRISNGIIILTAEELLGSSEFTISSFTFVINCIPRDACCIRKLYTPCFTPIYLIQI